MTIDIHLSSQSQNPLYDSGKGREGKGKGKGKGMGKGMGKGGRRRGKKKLLKRKKL